MKPLSWIAGGLFVLVAICLFGTASEHLFLGWLYFPFRVLPQVTVDPPAALIGVVSVIGFVVLLHMTMRWLRAGTVWTWRSTAALATFVLILFAAGTSMVGAVHQTVWLTFRKGSASASQDRVPGFLDSAKTAAVQWEEEHHIRSLALAADYFHDQAQFLPPGGTMTADGKLLHGWAIYIAPYGLFSGEGVDFATPWNQPPNARLFKCNFREFVNPALSGPYFDAEGYGYSHVAGNIRVLPIRTINPGQPPVTDYGDSTRAQLASQAPLRQAATESGASNTILLGSVTERFKPWGHPANIRDPALGLNRSPDGFAAPPGWSGAVFAMCDGSTRAISRKIDPEVLRQLATPASGERVPEEVLNGR